MADELWQKLAAMRIEPEGAQLTFPRKLAMENGWSRAYTTAVMREYRRFLYLAAGGPVCPSDAIDQAWHLHLTYSRHYWNVLCGEILGKPLHHGPTAGGTGQRGFHGNLYAATLQRYRAVFGAEPPADIWPGDARRFGERFQRVSRSDYWLVPRPQLLAQHLVRLVWPGRADLGKATAFGAGGASAGNSGCGGD